MNAYSTAQAAYAPSAAPTKTDRSNEYDVIAQVTRRLRSASSAESANFSDLAQALHDNDRLWRFLATCVADKDNALPAGLRADILSLADFSLKHGSRVLNRKAGASPLIEVNTAIMKGLRARAAAA